MTVLHSAFGSFGPMQSQAAYGRANLMPILGRGYSRPEPCAERDALTEFRPLSTTAGSFSGQADWLMSAWLGRNASCVARRREKHPEQGCRRSVRGGQG